MRILSGDRLVDVLAEIDDATVELEEANESGDLEDRMEAALKLEELKAAHFRACCEETGG